ncbi:hypothetical protein CK203_067671 [Vitis vinifera]|uniref:Uncharacterized protein n=1 Tax=Vitis vinifera TaxID=29760 RepID=A0A438EBX5_VITVI|nr:hypothetical protein CK203_067671 [Vitis vinifera]
MGAAIFYLDLNTLMICPYDMCAPIKISTQDSKQEGSKNKKDDDEEDNWEVPEGDFLFDCPWLSFCPWLDVWVGEIVDLFLSQLARGTDGKAFVNIMALAKMGRLL